MIFLTLGTMNMPFDRLLRFIDQAVEKGIITDEVVAQIGNTSYKPKNFKYFSFLEKEHFDFFFREADVVISHAGIGNILLAIDFQKPIIVVPRQKKFNEHVNDHQVQTAKKFEHRGIIQAIYDFDDLNFLKKSLERAGNLSGKALTSRGSIKIAEFLTSALDLKAKNIVVAASAGGHMTQLLRILNTEEGKKINISQYVTSLDVFGKTPQQRGRFHILGECNRKTPFKMIKVLLKSFSLSKRLKPDVVISTGALPAAFFCFWAKERGAKVVWIDSIANTESLSMSGRFIRKYADILLTQWPELEDETKNCKFVGSIL